MRRRTATAVLAFVAASFACTTPLAVTLAADPPTTVAWDAVDAYLAQARNELGIPGLAFVAVQDGKVIRQTAIGVADGTGRPISPQTPFLLASVSKAFTATAVMQLVDAGQVGLDDPVQRHLPWFTVADTDAGGRITIRQLLNQTSGLSTASGLTYHDSDDQDAAALERGVRNLAFASLLAAPGDAYTYSNANYDVLGAVVQAVSGQQFAEYLEEHIYAPLAMEHSHATRAAAEADGVAAGFYPWFDAIWRPTHIPVPFTGAPSATTYSSAEDLGHWLVANLDDGTYEGVRIASEDAMAQLHGSAVEIDEFNSYAMGWQLRPLWESLDPSSPSGSSGVAGEDQYELPLLIEHNGSWPNAHAYVGMIPAWNLGFAVLVNANEPRDEGRLGSLEQNVLRLLAGRDVIPPFPSDDILAANAIVIAALLLLGQFVAGAWAVRVVRRRPASPDNASSRRRRVLIGAALAVALDVAVLWLFVVYAPSTYDVTFPVLVRSLPDLGLLIVPGVALAAVWGPIRSVLLVRTAMWSELSRAPNSPAGPARTA